MGGGGHTFGGLIAKEEVDRQAGRFLRHQAVKLKQLWRYRCVRMSGRLLAHRLVNVPTCTKTWSLFSRAQRRPGPACDQQARRPRSRTQNG